MTNILVLGNSQEKSTWLHAQNSCSFLIKKLCPEAYDLKLRKYYIKTFQKLEEFEEE